MTATAHNTRAEHERIEFGVQRLFGFVADGLAAATQAFIADDRSSAADLVAEEPMIDALRRDVEDLAESLIVQRAVLTDEEVRLLIAVVHVVPELERSADLVEHIALRTGLFAEALPTEIRALIAEMGHNATAMWRTARDAWTRRDPSGLAALRLSDDAIDDLHVRLTEQLSHVPLTTPQAIELGLVARFFERLGDHAVNVTSRLQSLEPSYQQAG